MIGNIEAKLAEESEAMEGNTTASCSANQSERLQEFKNDLVHQCLISGHQTIQNLYSVLLNEKNKYSGLYASIEFTPELQLAMVQAIDNRRLHMIAHAHYSIQFKLTAHFQPPHSTMNV